MTTIKLGSGSVHNFTVLSHNTEILELDTEKMFNGKKKKIRLTGPVPQIPSEFMTKS